MMFTRRIIGIAATVMLTFAGFASAQQSQGAQAELHNGRIYVLDQQTLSILDAETLDVQQSVDLQQAIQSGPRQQEAGEEQPWYRSWFEEGNGEEPQDGEEYKNGEQPKDGAMTNGSAQISGKSLLAVDDSGVFIYYNNKQVHRFSVDDLSYETSGRLEDTQRQRNGAQDSEMSEPQDGLEEDAVEEPRNGLEDAVEEPQTSNGTGTEDQQSKDWMMDDSAEPQDGEQANGMSSSASVGEAVDMKVHNSDVYVLTSDRVFVLTDDLQTARSASLTVGQGNGQMEKAETDDGGLFGSDEGKEPADGMGSEEAKLIVGDEGVFVVKGEQIHRFTLSDLQREGEAPVDGSERDKQPVDGEEPVDGETPDDQIQEDVQEEGNGGGWFN